MVAIVIIGMWHVVDVSMISSRLRERVESQSPGGEEPSVYVNPLTDMVYVTVTAPKAGTGPYADAFTLGAAVGTKLAEPGVERELGKTAREYLDVYALVLPYKVSIRLTGPDKEEP